MFDRILIATDGSSTAMRAEERAAQLARLHGSALFAAFAVLPAKPDSKPFGGDGPNPIEVGKGALAGLAKRFSDLSPETHLIEAKPLEGIIEVSDKVGADLVVVGNVGLGSAVQRVKGSVPHALAHHAPADLLIARTSDSVHHARVDQGGELAPYAKLVVGVDGSATSMETLRHACALALGSDAAVVALHVGGDADILAKAVAVAKDAGVDATTRGDSGSPAETIVKVAADEGADLLVVGNVGMKERASFDRSVPNKVTHDAPCDLLLVKTA